MGCALMAELVANRPPSPGPEWWLLLDLAADADDLTRRTMPGYDYMTGRHHAPRATVYRWMKKLHDAGLVVTVEKSAGASSGKKGKRAVYEIQVSPAIAARIAAHLARESGLTGGDPTVSAEDATRVSPDGTRVGQNGVRGGSRVSQLVGPPIYGPVSETPAEGAQERRDPEHAAKPRIKIDPLNRPERLREGAGRAGRTSTPEDLQPDSSVRDRRGVSSPLDVDVTHGRARGAA